MPSLIEREEKQTLLIGNGDVLVSEINVAVDGVDMFGIAFLNSDVKSPVGSFQPSESHDTLIDDAFFTLLTDNIDSLDVVIQRLQIARLNMVRASSKNK